MPLKPPPFHQILIFRQLIGAKVVLIGAKEERLVGGGKCDGSDGCANVTHFRHNLFVG